MIMYDAKKAYSIESRREWAKMPNYRLDQKITLLVDGNPKKRTAGLRFAEYKNGLTVAEYIAAVVRLTEAGAVGPFEYGPEDKAHRDLRWDVLAGLIRVD
jgi:hypothetical protein